MPSIYRAKDLIKALRKLDKEIARGTFSSILTQSNLTKKELEAKL